MLKKKEFNDQRIISISPYIKNKIVLDVGCYAEIGELINNENKPRWIHGFLKKYAKEVIGIDITKDKIDILKKQGYDVYCQSAETFKFNKKFDVIFAGDVIEHLSNPGLFLDSSWKHLKKNGLLIITTPNVFALNYKIGGLIRLLNNDLKVHPEHTLWFSPTVIKSLLNRHHFTMEKIKFVNFQNADTIKRFLQNLLCDILGDKLRYSMVVFAKPKRKE